jgi:hypothetical protein
MAPNESISAGDENLLPSNFHDVPRCLNERLQCVLSHRGPEKTLHSHLRNR